mgnify:CR=1 FL=1
MFTMMAMAKRTASLGLLKIDGWFRRTFKEQAGGAELIATLIIVGIVLILAFIFKDQLIQNLWNGLLKNGDKDTNQGDVVPEWT